MCSMSKVLSGLLFEVSGGIGKACAVCGCRCLCARSWLLLEEGKFWAGVWKAVEMC